MADESTVEKVKRSATILVMGKLIRNAVFTVVVLASTAYSLQWQQTELAQVKVTTSAAATISHTLVKETHGSINLSVRLAQPTVRLGQKQTISLTTEPYAVAKIVIKYPKPERTKDKVVTISADANGLAETSLSVNDATQIGIFSVLVEVANNKGSSQSEHRFSLVSWGATTESTKYQYPLAP